MTEFDPTHAPPDFSLEGEKSRAEEAAQGPLILTRPEDPEAVIDDQETLPDDDDGVAADGDDAAEDDPDEDGPGDDV